MCAVACGGRPRAQCQQSRVPWRTPTASPSPRAIWSDAIFMFHLCKSGTLCAQARGVHTHSHTGLFQVSPSTPHFARMCTRLVCTWRGLGHICARSRVHITVICALNARAYTYTGSRVEMRAQKMCVCFSACMFLPRVVRAMRKSGWPRGMGVEVASTSMGGKGVIRSRAKCGGFQCASTHSQTRAHVHAYFRCACVCVCLCPVRDALNCGFLAHDVRVHA